MDANAIARALVAEMSDAVHRHFLPRSDVVAPPRLTGHHQVPGAKLGEQVLDHADELLQTECETWLPGREPDVALDLRKEENGWVVSWVIECDSAHEGAEKGAEEGQGGA